MISVSLPISYQPSFYGGIVGEWPRLIHGMDEWKPKNLWFWVFLDARRKTFYILYSIIQNYAFSIYIYIYMYIIVYIVYIYIYIEIYISYVYIYVYIYIYTIWARIHMVTVYGLQNWSNLILQPPTATGSRHLLQRHIPCKWLARGVPLWNLMKQWTQNLAETWRNLD